MLNFEMELKIKFNRKINKDIDYISPGGFSMVMNGREIGFDFMTHYGNVDKSDATLCEFWFKEPDVDSFEELNNITEDELKNITSIKECYVYTGESDEEGSDLHEIEIKNIVFYVYNEDDEPTEIIIDHEVLNEYNRTLVAGTDYE